MTQQRLQSVQNLELTEPATYSGEEAQAYCSIYDTRITSLQLAAGTPWDAVDLPSILGNK